MASGGMDGLPVPLIIDTLSFDMRQEQRLKDMEKRMQDEVRKKKKEWEREVDKMKVEFLTLHAADKHWGSDELINDPLISKRRGSTDVLDPKKMKTMFLEYPDTGSRRFKLRFNLCGFERKSVRVSTDGDRIQVAAVRHEEQDNGKMVEKHYVRKIEKPREVDCSKLKSYYTQDNILIVEAPLPPVTLNLRKLSHSPSHSSHGSCHSSHASSRSRSPSSSPSTPQAKHKFGLPQFLGNDGEKVMSLLVDIGLVFKPKDITLQVIKDNRIQVKAKNEIRTTDRLSKNKFFKEYELSEKIETLTLRGGLTENGKLIVGALCKGHPLFNKKDFQEAAANVEKHINDKNCTVPCNVLDLASFPPTHTVLAGSSDFNSENNG